MSVERSGVRAISTSSRIPHQQLRVRCPGCLELVALENLAGSEGDLNFGQSSGPGFAAGQRRCPNNACRAHVFAIYAGTAQGSQVLAIYPPEVLSFDPQGLPEKVLAAFQEAIVCHAHGAWTASAMMVRKTLEELCADRGATGKTLFDRLNALKTEVMLPPVLFEGLDALRLLGNDAAHVESRDYERVGKEEVEVAIALTQEILKSSYQMDSIVGRLMALKRKTDDLA